MSKIFQRYRNIPRSVLILIGVKFLVSILNGSFFLILNIYLRKLGYSDPDIGSYGSMLYLGILLVGLPLGLFLRGRRLKPLYLIGSIGIPIFAILLLQALRLEADAWLTKSLLLAWSGSLVLIDGFTLAYILRNVPKESESEAIAMSYGMFALGSVFSGLFIFLVNRQDYIFLLGKAIPCDEYLALMVVACLNLPCFVLVLLMKESPPSEESKVRLKGFFDSVRTYDWKRIGRAVFPTSIIAVGAGLTVPFINLFFNSVFGLDSDSWGLIGMGTSVLIFLAAVLVPLVRRRFGYRVAITLSQCLSVLMLTLLALTELFAQVPGMVYLAIFFFMLRTPLMNMAGPMTSELVMNFVGPENRDFTSALIPSIWSGSWFLSALFFQYMRDWELPYYQIFLLTSLFYVFGIWKYYQLIGIFEKEQQEIAGAKEVE